MNISLAQLHQRLLGLLRPLHSEGEASAIANIFVEDALGKTRSAVLADEHMELTTAQHEHLEAQLQRLASGEPVQYVVQKARFADQDFRVSPAVLIPRPETEGLVDWAWESVCGQVSRVLDIGTGSGCIAITLDRKLPLSTLEAWDISPEALDIARHNAATLGANVTFEQRDMLREAEVSDTQPPTYHLIVSNPPYIPQSEAAQMEAHVVEHEPHTALFVPDDDPLCYYRALGKIALSRLLPEGSLIVETHRDLCVDTAQLLANMGFREVLVQEDCFGQNRFVKATK